MAAADAEFEFGDHRKIHSAASGAEPGESGAVRRDPRRSRRGRLSIHRALSRAYRGDAAERRPANRGSALPRASRRSGLRRDLFPGGAPGTAAVYPRRIFLHPEGASGAPFSLGTGGVSLTERRAGVFSGGEAETLPGGGGGDILRRALAVHRVPAGDSGGIPGDFHGTAGRAAGGFRRGETRSLPLLGAARALRLSAAGGKSLSGTVLRPPALQPELRSRFLPRHHAVPCGRHVQSVLLAGQRGTDREIPRSQRRSAQLSAICDLLRRRAEQLESECSGGGSADALFFAEDDAAGEAISDVVAPLLLSADTSAAADRLG